ncbi:MAG: hypothetical protein ACYTXC_04505 [Nostoc sp.]
MMLEELLAESPMRDRLQYVVSKRELLYCSITRFFVISILK